MLICILILDLMHVRLDWLLWVCEKPCGSEWSTSLLVPQIGGATDVLAAASSCASCLVAGLARPRSYAMVASSPQLWQQWCLSQLHCLGEFLVCAL
jgi:hypothetical protein